MRPARASPARRRGPQAHPGDPFDRADRLRRRPSARSRRLRRKASAPSRSRSASIPIATSRWCGAIRETVGPDVALCCDANQGYKTPGEAIRTFRRMERYDLIYFEQPVEGIERLAEVARAIDAPVMADESAWNAHDVIQIIEKRAAQIVSIYTTKPGGLYRAMEVAAVARAAGLICNVNGSVETGIGNLANLQLAAAAPAAVLSCVVPVSTPAEAQSRAGWRHLLQGRPDRRADAVRRWGDRAADGRRHGHCGRRGEDRALQRRRQNGYEACARM